MNSEQNHKRENKNMQNNNTIEETVNIYTFSILLHFYIFIFDKIIHYNPLLFIILSSFILSIIYSLTNLSFLNFCLHRYWFKQTYQIALPQLIQSVSNIIILQPSSSITFSFVLSTGVYFITFHNFNKYEYETSKNIRFLLTFITLFIKYILYFILA